MSVNCENKNVKKERLPEQIPYIVHEYELAKAERRARTLFWALAGTVSALLISNTVWICLLIR